MLLRDGDEHDKYAEYLRRHGFAPRFVPVLQTEFKSLDELNDKCLSAQSFSGLIITSQNAVKALRMVDYEQFQSLKCYVVGPATGKSLKDLGFNDIVGESCGNAENLAELIKSSHKENLLPLLFLTGDKTRSIIQDALIAAQMRVQCISVYETHNIAVDHHQIMSSIVVLFSPSGLNSFPRVEDLQSSKWVAIGPTTSSALAKLGIPSIECKTPTPEGVLEAIQQMI